MDFVGGDEYIEDERYINYDDNGLFGAAATTTNVVSSPTIAVKCFWSAVGLLLAWKIFFSYKKKKGEEGGIAAVSASSFAGSGKNKNNNEKVAAQRSRFLAGIQQQQTKKKDEGDGSGGESDRKEDNNNDNNNNNNNKTDHGEEGKKKILGGDNDDDDDEKEGGKDDEKKTTKKNKQKIVDGNDNDATAPPSAQILCRALSVVTGGEVTVGDEGSIRGWIEKPYHHRVFISAPSSFSAEKERSGKHRGKKIVLPLSGSEKNKNFNNEECDIAKEFDRVLSFDPSPFDDALILAEKDMDRIERFADWHASARKMQREGSAAVLTLRRKRPPRKIIINADDDDDDDGEEQTKTKKRDPLPDLMRSFSLFLAESCSRWISPHVPGSEKEEDNDNDDDSSENSSIGGGGLFDDDYGTLSFVAANQKEETNGNGNNDNCGDPYDALLSLVDKLPSSPNLRFFLDDLFAAHDDDDDSDLRRNNHSNNHSNNNNKAGDGNGGGRLASAVLMSLLDRLSKGSSSSSSSSFSPLEQRQRLSSLSQIVAGSARLTLAASQRLLEEQQRGENNDNNGNGREFEENSMIGPLFWLCAFSVPSAGMEDPATSNKLCSRYTFYRRLQKGVQGFPATAFEVHQHHRNRSSAAKELDRIIDETRDTMIAARDTAICLLRSVMAKKKKKGTVVAASSGVNGKDVTFGWLAETVLFNQAAADALKADLLNPDGVAAVLSSRPFLLGILSAISRMSVDDLNGIFLQKQQQTMTTTTSSNDNSCGGENDGWWCDDMAFDPRYLESGKLRPSNDEKPLVVVSSNDHPAPSSSEKTTVEAVRFAGSTHLFFSLMGLMRVSLFPLIRARDELHLRYQRLFASLRNKEQQPSSSEQLLRRNPNLGAPVAAFFGFEAFLTEPNFVRDATNLSILGLRWLARLGKNDDDDDDENNKTNNKTKNQQQQQQQQRHRCRRRREEYFRLVPEWMCKVPALWLSCVADRSPHLIKPNQADNVIQCVTELLQIYSGGGCSRNSSSNPSSSPPPPLFSPIVVTELVRIASSFVRAGVSRAAHRRRARQQRGRMRRDDGLDDDDNDVKTCLVTETGGDFYTTFDKNDLGVTVYTNRYVCTYLCSTLLKTFSSVDAVEGLDVDKELHFDKFSIKSDVAELFLRIWCHPNGEARRLFCERLETVDLQEALSRFVVSATESLGYLLDDACNEISYIASVKAKGGTMYGRDKVSFEHRENFCTNQLLMARRILLLLCTLAKEPDVAAFFGEGAIEKKSEKNKGKHVRSLSNMIVYFLDKLTDPNGGTNPELSFTGTNSLEMMTSAMGYNEQVATAISKDLVEARAFAYREYGLHAANLCHELLALASRVHKESVRNESVGFFVKSFTELDDCDVERYKGVFSRLISRSNVDSKSQVSSVFRVDGYVEDMNLYGNSYGGKKDGGHARRMRAKTEQVSREYIECVASTDEILKFLQSLEECAASREANFKSFTPGDVDKAQHLILTQKTPVVSNDDYTSRLKEWMLSSDLLQGNHVFEAIARGKTGLVGNGIQKEPRRCKRALPTPYPNSATFVCFGEERMDLSSAVITGPIETPYAHGIFTFDVYFPPTYPQIPPLLEITSTGGGQTRFNPNLYQDGKVCLSLLGTFHAGDESQKWNPKFSSLAQVLLSIQTQLLVSEPYFNEPGYEARRGTQAGEEGSSRYNEKLKLATLRHAVLTHLKDPPRGFEEVCHKHFSMCRKRIVCQARRWTLETQDASMRARFERAYNELLYHLSSEKMMHYDALPPLPDDLKALERLDPDFFQLLV